MGTFLIWVLGEALAPRGLEVALVAEGLDDQFVAHDPTFPQWLRLAPPSQHRLRAAHAHQCPPLLERAYELRLAQLARLLPAPLFAPQPLP